MNIIYNDLTRELSEGTTVAELIQQLDLEPRFVAVEVNFEVIPREKHAQHVLHDGDKLEIVTLVGGG
ncbi:MAG: thiamine biosynthesis protein ThiS [Myxococcales bacterium]|nr:thiamine biosynthesis protein ThiS [Myxococcales bacterium]MCH2129580.1 sulfur carrier protein ThiS [Pirellulaceae bacterium]